MTYQAEGMYTCCFPHTDAYICLLAKNAMKLDGIIRQTATYDAYPIQYILGIQNLRGEMVSWSILLTGTGGLAVPRYCAPVWLARLQ